MAISCTANDLAAEAKCLNDIPTDMKPAVMIYLLAVIAGESVDKDVLVQKAACLAAIPGDMQIAVQNYLLCQIATVLGA